MEISARLNQSQIQSINALCKKYYVRELHVFGSLLTSRFNKKSDVDFLVAFQKLDFGDYADAYFGLADDLEALLGRKVDLVTEKSLKNPYFIESVEKNKKLLYAA